MNKVISTYDLSIYTEGAILTAIKYYASICNIEYHIEEGKGICCFDVDQKHAEIVVKEFGNFLIEILQHELGDAYDAD